MRAVVLEQHGGPDVLIIRDIPEPLPPPGWVKVRVRACALNHLDLWARQGLPGIRYPLPLVLGNDVAGEVAELGQGVEGVERGTEVVLAPGVSCGRCEACAAGDDNFCRQYRVLGNGLNGGYAEYVVVPAANLLPKPAQLSWAEAAAVPLVFLTAWHMLVHKSAVRPGEDVLILAAGSGVGVAGIQIAKLFGARVLAAASSDDKLAKARGLGADETINYSTLDFAAEVRRLTDKKGVEIVFEHTGQDTWAKSILAVARGGRIVTCGATSGYEAITDLRHVFSRQIRIIGSYMGRRAELFEVLRWMERGKLRPVVDRVLPLAQAAEAHRVLEARQAFGKVVLEI
ncbi:MAG TPA: zinc-binding dehydrogenase [Candidatus Eisenbacteria bacterium]|nr:zinc-binding dehydrogenase [Candidatus Eisenbacteria bacterium]